MKVSFRLDSQITENRRAIYWDDVLSHHIDEEELQVLLKQARTNAWKSDEQEGLRFGLRLFQLLDRAGGQLTQAMKAAHDRGEALYFYLDIPFELDALPFELIHDQHFLLLQRDLHLIRRVNDRNRLQTKGAEDRELKLLFMACSPLDLEEAVLQFEKEEELILKATERFPLNMVVEDSGSLAGLEYTLWEASGVDILHLSGHAGIEPKRGPVFYMEDEIGSLVRVSPDQLWEAIRDFPPRILFLSGCSTGKGDKLNGSEAFAHRMVDTGLSHKKVLEIQYN
jgi:hypothetical protein